MSEQAQRPQRERGIYIPAGEVEIHIANGWKIIDIPADCDDVLMRAPAANVQEAA